MSKISSKWLAKHAHRLDPHLVSFLRKPSNFLRYLSTPQENSPSFTSQSVKHVPVLVQCTNASTFSALQNHLKGLGLIVNQSFKHINTVSIPMHLTHLPKVLNLPEIKKVYLDRKVSALLNNATPTTGATTIWSKLNKKGDDVTIAIVDTGISPHADLGSRIIGFKDFISNKRKAYDDNGHGTHCAGCAAGNGALSNGLYRGTAPNASLVGVKVLDQKGSGSLSNVIAGIQWCIRNKNKYNIRVISLSLGSVAELSYKEDPICQIVDLAWKSGIVVVAAAGNSGPKAKTISSPGNHPSIITVGATDDRGTNDPADDTIANFSSRGPTPDGIFKPDVVAPGTNIVSLRSPSSYLDRITDSRVGKNYCSMSGTSMATPLVAGICALMLSINPSLTPAEVKQKLKKGAISLGLPSTVQGSGVVSADRSIMNSQSKRTRKK